MDEDKGQSRFRSEGGQKRMAQELIEKAEVLNGMPPANVIRFSPAPDCVTNSKLPIMEKVETGCFPPRYYLDKDASSRFASESPVAKLLGDEINPLTPKRIKSATEADFVLPVVPEPRQRSLAEKFEDISNEILGSSIKVKKLLGDEIGMKKVPSERQLHAGKKVMLADLLVQRWYNGCPGRIVKELPDKTRWKVKVQTYSNTTVCLAVSAKNMM